MPLPDELSSIFRNKQRSYKMVLILALIDEYRATNNKLMSLDNIARRFLAFFQSSIAEGRKVDSPPSGVASNWGEFTQSQIKSLLYTPIKALSAILDESNGGQTISFKSSIWDKLNEATLDELQRYAVIELDNYNNSLAVQVSLQHSLTEIMRNYIRAKTQSFSGHPLGNLLRQNLPENIKKLHFIDDTYKVQGSIGQGNWANIPWLAILDKRLTETTQYGEYVVYLFAEDMSSVYLTLAQGVTVPLKEKGKKDGYHYLEQKVQEMRELLPLENMQKDDNIHLTSSGLGRDYQVSTVAYIRYDRDHIPDDDQLIADLENMMTNYRLYADTVYNKGDKENRPVTVLNVAEHIKQIKAYIKQKGFHYPGSLIENLYLSFKTKPFVILAGVSGTGKTKLVKLFAEALGATNENKQFTLIPVRPDWSDPSDLLGYKDLSGAFRPGQLAEVLAEASKAENRRKPYFICLDEMNLARVEHYFSDLLSIIETQEWRGDQIITSRLIQKEALRPEDQPTYGDLFLTDNVYLIGTVNMDETTHPFSKKVLDRANTVEFNYIHLGQFPDEINSSDADETLQLDNSFLRSDYLHLIDAYQEHRDLVHRTTEKLVKINTILEEIHSHVGFRIRDAVCFYMIYNERFQLLSEDAAFDMQLLQKILPRVQGSSATVKRVLLQLMQGAIGKSLAVAELMEDASELYTKWSANEPAEAAKHPQTARKIAFMLRRLEEDGFTSYWLT